MYVGVITSHKILFSCISMSSLSCAQRFFSKMKLEAGENIVTQLQQTNLENRIMFDYVQVPGICTMCPINDVIWQSLWFRFLNFSWCLQLFFNSMIEFVLMSFGLLLIECLFESKQIFFATALTYLGGEQILVYALLLVMTKFGRFSKIMLAIVL